MALRIIATFILGAILIEYIIYLDKQTMDVDDPYWEWDSEFVELEEEEYDD